MLVLSRKVSENIMIGDDIEIIVTQIEHGVTRIAINAPREIRILRGELYRQSQRESQPPAGLAPE